MATIATGIPKPNPEFTVSREGVLRAEFRKLWAMRKPGIGGDRDESWYWFLMGATAERDARLPAEDGRLVMPFTQIANPDANVTVGFGVAPEATVTHAKVDRDDPDSIAAAIRAAVDGK